MGGRATTNPFVGAFWPGDAFVDGEISGDSEQRSANVLSLTSGVPVLPGPLKLSLQWVFEAFVVRVGLPIPGG